MIKNKFLNWDHVRHDPSPVKALAMMPMTSYSSHLLQLNGDYASPEEHEQDIHRRARLGEEQTYIIFSREDNMMYMFNAYVSEDINSVGYLEVTSHIQTHEVPKPMALRSEPVFNVIDQVAGLRIVTDPKIMASIQSQKRPDVDIKITKEQSDQAIANLDKTFWFGDFMVTEEDVMSMEYDDDDYEDDFAEDYDDEFDADDALINASRDGTLGVNTQ